MTTNHSSARAEPSQDPTNDFPGETAFMGPATTPTQSSPFLNGKCQEAIHEAVVRLLQGTRKANDRRWVPRAQYVRPAWAHFKQPPSPQGERDRTVLVATTDISFEGAGVLSWQEIPVRHLVLKLSGVWFACSVRWRRVLAGQIYRYGLHFYKVLDKPLHDVSSES